MYISDTQYIPVGEALPGWPAGGTRKLDISAQNKVSLVVLEYIYIYSHYSSYMYLTNIL